MPIPPNDYLELAAVHPPSVWSVGNTTGTVPTQYPTGPYITWHGALVPDWAELVRRLEGRVDEERP